MSEEYELIVIGSGQGGDPLARAFANAGKKAALIERAELGGTCINTGCTPTKTMYASAHVAYLASRASDFGVITGPVTVDQAKIRKRKRAIVNDFRQSTEQNIGGIKNLHLIRGSAKFIRPKTLEVSGENSQVLSAKLIVIDAGCKPMVPNLPGLDQVPFLDNESIMELKETPNHLIVLGGGYIGLEFAQMFKRFGSKVSVIERGSQLLGREDQDVAEAVTKILEEDKITVLLEAEVESLAKNGKGIQLKLLHQGKSRTVSGSHLLVALGRSPNTPDLDLGATGVKIDDKGFIRVNEKLETNVEGIYAIGDINGGPQFTHISYDDYRILKANLLDGGKRTTSDRQIPYVVFLDPQLGRVGLSETEAKKKKIKYKLARINMNEIARPLESDQTRGFMKALVDPTTDQILGCAVLGMEGGELLATLQVAMMGKLPYAALRDGVFSHPTLAESLNKLFMRLE